MTVETARDREVQSAVEARNEEVRCILAHRIDSMAKAIDAERERAKGLRSGQEFAKVALSIEGALTALEELERVWECLFEDIPSLLEVGRLVSSS